MTRAALTPLTLLLTLLLPTGPGQATATAKDPAAATPVSPGDWQAGVQVADTCPSFSWGAVAGAQRYELAIFDAQWDASPTYEEQQRQGVQLRQIAITAPALSWTPAGADCLDTGGTYLWFIRAQTAEGESPWSAPRYFEIDYDSDALTQTVRRELAAQLRQPEVWREVIQAALASNPTLRLTSLVPGVVAPTSGGEGTTADGAGRDRLGSVTEQGVGVLATTFPYPSALKINSPNGVVFNQSATGVGIPAEGAGVRFMWYPGKAALRAGVVTGAQWNNTNVGSNSMAMGANTTARGGASTAMGDGTTASGGASTAMGDGTTASGVASTAMGYSTEASGDYSTAMGNSTTASGESSTAMGSQTTASGQFSTATGRTTTASGEFSTAMGWLTTASSDGTTAMGIDTTASGFRSTAMGNSTTATSAYETAIGRYNTDYDPGSTTDWVSTDRLFVIGNGSGTGSNVKSDALVLLKNGNVGIGTSTPTYRLQLSTNSAAKPGSTTWTIASDARLKDITGPYDSGLDEIAALQPVRFHYAADNARGHDPEPEYVGFIAQQAQAVFPEAVSEGADGYLDFNMHAVNVAMVNAIQTLNEQNQVQQELILDLRSENTVLMQRLGEQEQRYATQEQRLITLEKENARLASLQADLAQIQAQLRVLQGQMAGETSHAQVALGR
jgi:uncharacterized coiled-coil protein SlyX